jgi:hypothetical protein
MSEPMRQIDYEDVDDIIGVAAELQQLDEDRLSVEELVSVGRDLDIPEKYVQPAIAELRRRRQATLAADARRRKTRRLYWLIAGGALAVVIVWALIGQSSLSSALAEVEQARAQVANVVERRREVRAQWESAPDGRERTAELAGADNRVSVERRRYDEVAAAYNAKVNAFPSSLWAAIFGYPGDVPLSNTIGTY